MLGNIAIVFFLALGGYYRKPFIMGIINKIFALVFGSMLVIFHCNSR